MNFKVLLFSVICVLTFGSAFSQAAANPVKWEYSYEAINENEGYVVIKAKIEKDWHVYSQAVVADGPIPTSFQFISNASYELVEKTNESPSEKVYSEMFGADVASFSNEAVFKQKIRRKTKNEFSVSAELEFMACNNSMCLPPKTIPFSVNIPAK